MTPLFCEQCHPAGFWNPPTRRSLKALTRASSAKPTVSPSPRSRGRKRLVRERLLLLDHPPPSMHPPPVDFVCSAGDTPGDYTDLKLSNPDISVEDGTLSINNIQKTNEGYYLCEAVNGIGAGLSAVIFISVQGETGAPSFFYY